MKELTKVTKIMKPLIFIILICSSFMHQTFLLDIKMVELESSETLKLIITNKSTSKIVEQAIKESESVKTFVVFNLILYNLFLSLASLDENYLTTSIEKFNLNSKHILYLLNIKNSNYLSLAYVFNDYKESFEQIKNDSMLIEISKKFILEKLKEINSNLNWSDSAKLVNNLDIDTISISNKTKESDKFTIVFNSQLDDFRKIFTDLAGELRPLVFPLA